MTFYLQKLQLINFRCYRNKVFEFGPQRNIIVGANAVGKTSLVEGVYCLGFAKTFKNVKDLDLIKKDESYYNLKGDFLNNDTIDKVIISYNQKDKRVIKNNYTYKSISDYVGYFNVITFSPDDLELIKGSPNIRRRFLDIHLGQINPSYLQALINYKKILRERNEYLKGIVNNQYDKVLLNVLTSSLIKEAKVIIEEREALIKDINQYINPIIEKLSKKQEKLILVYKPNCNVDKLWKSADEKLNNDILMQTTTWGPARDELLILVNNENASTFCSQGQIRSACLAIKLALVELMKQKNKRVIIILDDVFSELDNHRQNEILELLDNDKQTFITTTSIDNLSSEIIKNSNVINIERGNDDE